jgi:hypothetical protein
MGEYDVARLSGELDDAHRDPVEVVVGVHEVRVAPRVGVVGAREIAQPRIVSHEAQPVGAEIGPRFDLATRDETLDHAV